MTDAARSTSPDPLRVVGGVAHALANAGDIDQTLRAIASAAMSGSAADSVVVFLQDPDRTGLETATALGVPEPDLDRLRETLERDDDPVAATARERAARRTSGGSDGFASATGSVRAAFEPLVVSRGGIDLSLGVLAVGWQTPGEPDADAAVLLTLLAQLASVAVDHARLASLVSERSEWFERMAQSDPLTGLANLRTFGRVLELEIARAGRQGSEVSVAVFDIDGFVAINQAGGHEAGDDVLRAVAGVLNESVRLVDTVARIGGDEFVLVAPGPAGATVARRVLEGVGRLQPVAGRTISISAGIARFPGDATGADELVEAALAALAAAKEQGQSTMQESSGQPAS